MLSLSSLGYRCIVPSLRGFGDTNALESSDDYTKLRVVGDLIGMLDPIGVEKAFLVGHDWGANVARYLCLFRPERVTALVNTSVAFTPRNPGMKPVEGFRKMFGDDYYMCKFQAREKLRRILRGPTSQNRKGLSREPCSNPPIIPKEVGCSGLAQLALELPTSLTEDDVAYYATKFSEKGFTGGLNYY